jgi:NADPH-dependent 2,4-dienoyl-CoA reductase/sulfur reductase-like enzyme
MSTYKYLIIGGGMTADAAAKGIRSVDKDGSVGLVTEETDPPYFRPPLTKDLWTGDASVDEIWCHTKDKNITLFQGQHVCDLNPAEQTVATEGGDVFQYEYLLIATGGRPRKLNMEDEGVIYYRTYRDYVKLQELCQKAEHIGVLGGGFIGAEIVAALTSNQKEVTMVFPESEICGSLLPAPFAQKLNHYYEKQGVKVITNRSPESIDFDAGVWGIRLKNGHMFSVDAIVAGIGIEPNTELAASAGLRVGDGIMVDENLRTSDSHIYAAGDVACFYNPLLDQRLRVEHEDNALTMGEMAGRNMAGQQEKYQHLPYFYSDLFDVGYEAIGITDPSLEVITTPASVEEKGCIFYLEKERVRGIIFWNLFDKVDAGRELIGAGNTLHEVDLYAWAEECAKQ